MEARNTTACISRSFLLISVCSQVLQVNMEDSGRTLATPSNPTINDEKCARGYCSICEVAAPVRRVTVRGLCQLSIFDRSIENVKLLFICTQITPVRSPGSTITSSMMTGSQCLSAATPLFSSTTDPSAPGFGTPNTRSTQYHMSCGGNTRKISFDLTGQVRSQGPQRCCHQSLTRSVTSPRFLWIFYFAETFKSLRCAQH